MWWQYIVGVVVLAVLAYCFIVLVGVRTRSLTRKTDRTAANMYDDYADLTRKQRKLARERRG